MYYHTYFPSKKVYVFIYECGVTNTAPEIFAVSTSNHNKAICRRSMYLRPRFGEGFLFMDRHTPSTYSLGGCYSHQYIDLCECCVSA